MNPFKYSCDNKRFYTYSYFLKQKFRCKVIKISLNSGLSCPNRDGTKGIGGCTYCSENKSGEFGGNPLDSIETQFKTTRQLLMDKWNNAKYIAYFQAGTNTYAPCSYLKKIYDEALDIKDVVGLSIATRADCITEEICKLLCKYKDKTFLTVELGLQSIFDKTAEYTNRQHTYEEFLKGYEMLRKYGINTCIHIINGMPFETHDMMLETIKEVARLHPHSVKIHLMHIIKGTKLADDFQNGDFKEMSYEDYINTVCDQLELLPEDVVIQRLTGDGDKKTLIAPRWSLDKRRVLNGIDKEMAKRNSWQGKYCKP